MTTATMQGTALRPFEHPYRSRGASLEKNQEEEFSVKNYSVSAPISIDVESIEIRSVPISLMVFNYLLLALSLFFISQFILAFFGVAIFHGLIGVVGFFSFFGLFKVFRKAAREIGGE